MARFKYAGLHATGETRRGLIEAASAATARQSLEAKGITPFSLSEAKGREGRPQVSKLDLSDFLADLGALHDAGVPLRRALEVLASTGSSRGTTLLATLMAERLDAGSNLEGAARLTDTGDIVLAAELIKAGEASGKLGDTLRFAGTLLRRQSDYSRRIWGALAYPIFLIVMSIGALVALAGIAGPSLAPLLEEAPDDANGLRVVLGVGAFITQNGPAILLGVATLLVALVLSLRRPETRRALAELRCRIPGIRPIVRDMNCGAFARTLGVLLSGGAPAATAVDLAAAATPNEAWRHRFLRAADRLREGQTVAATLQAIPFASQELGKLARVGEASGALGTMLVRAGDLAIERALRRLDQFAAMAGPVLILTMGGFTGWLMSVFLSGLSQLGEGGL